VSNKWFKNFSSIVFVLALLSVGLSFVFEGISKPYGKIRFSQINVSEVLSASNKPLALKEISDAITERSNLTRRSIQANYWVRYNIAGYVDTDEIISGQQGWLFYKEQFSGGNCIKARVYARVLRRMKVYSDLAKQTDLNVIFSIAPDKSQIYREYLSPTSFHYVGCSQQNGILWRELSKGIFPELIDHKLDIMDEKANRIVIQKDQLLYYKIDTHWNATVAPLVIKRLVSSIGDDTKIIIPDTNLLTRAILKIPDMLNVMLLQDRLERVSMDGFDIPVTNSDGAATYIVHDSFYNVIKMELDMAFNYPNFFRMSTDRGKYPNRIMNAEAVALVVVDSVERQFFRKFRNPYHPLYEAILGRNQSFARQYCTFDTPAKRIGLRNVEQIDAVSYSAQSNDPVLILNRSSFDMNCFRIELEVNKPSVFEIFLPNVSHLESGRHPYEEGRTISVKIKKGITELNFVLPIGHKVNQIHLHPINSKGNFSIHQLSWGKIKN